MKLFKHDGIWWDLNDPSQKWVGTIRFNNDWINLNLTVLVESPVSSPHQDHDISFLGHTMGGEEDHAPRLPP